MSPGSIVRPPRSTTVAPLSRPDSALSSPTASTLPSLIASAETTGAPGSGRIVPPRRMRSAPPSAAKAGAAPNSGRAEAAATE
jgi:hypothetical protein